MRERLTNAGKKEQRQVNQLLNKDLDRSRHPLGKEVEARTVPKQHSTRKQKSK